MAPQVSPLATSVSNTEPLYRPQDPHGTATFRFLDQVNGKYGLSLANYEDLYTWSVTHIDDFWDSVWDATGIVGHKGSHVVDKDAKPSENPPWFAEAKVNWAENMLCHRSPTKVALIQASQSYGHRLYLVAHAAELQLSRPQIVLTQRCGNALTSNCTTWLQISSQLCLRMD